MKILKLIAISVVLFVGVIDFAYCRQDLIGYGATRWLMTEDEVLRSDPRIQRLSSPLKFYKDVALSEIKEIDIDSKKFKVLFAFDEMKLLQRVHISNMEKDRNRNAEIFSSVEALLTQKYGTPTSKNQGVEITWKFPTTTISLAHVLPELSSTIVIQYKPSSEHAKTTKDL